MRGVWVMVGLLGGMLLAAPVVAQDQAQVSPQQQTVGQEVVRTLKRVATARAKALATTRASVRGGPAPLWSEASWGGGLVVEPELLALVKQASDSRSKSRASLHFWVLAAAVSDGDPKVRGLACEALALIGDDRAILPVGVQIEDSAAAAPQLFRRVPQVGGPVDHWTTPTVGEVARGALHALTSTRFAARADFEAWWQSRLHYPDDVLWYWATRWSGPALAHAWLPEADRERAETVVQARRGRADLPELARLPDDLGLKMLLLATNHWALQAEARRFLGNTKQAGERVYAAPVALDYASPRLEAKAAYVKQHHLEGRLLELLQGKRLYPEAAAGEYGPDVRRGLLTEITRLGPLVFGPNDEPAIAAVQRARQDPEAVETLALLRVQLVPSQGHAVLRNALEAYPQLSEVARELIHRYGAEDTAVLRKACAARHAEYLRETVAKAIEEAAAEGRPVPVATIRAVTQTVTVSDRARDRSYASALVALARTVNRVTGKAVISEADLKSITWSHAFKRPETAADLAHNALVPAACQAVKAKLLAALK